MLNWERWVDPRVASVRLADLQAYLKAHGWSQKPFPRPQILLYEGPLADDGEPLTLWVPSSERSADSWDLIVRVITTLSVLEDRPAVEVLNDILNRHAHGAETGKNGGDAASPPAGAQSVVTPGS